MRVCVYVRPSIGLQSAPLQVTVTRTTSVTDALVCFHRLRVPERVQYKIAVLVYTKSYTDSRRHILVHSTTSQTCLAADFSVLLPPTVWQCLRSSWQPSPTGLFPLSTHGPGTTCQKIWYLPSRCSFRQRLKTYLFTEFYSDYFCFFSGGPSRSVQFALLRPL